MCLGLQALCIDLGLSVNINLYSDSSAARGIAARSGLGKVRHVAVHLLWLQQQVRSGRIVIRGVAGSANPADVYTKHLGREALDKCCNLWRGTFSQGRSLIAPQVL